jgi:hypothetical protein
MGVTPHAILDPFAVYAEGEDLMRRQLGALSHDHLVSIVKAYELPVDVQQSMTDGRLIDDIVSTVARSAG